MCGICGVSYFDGKKVTKDQLSKMTDAMVHRGPDDEGFYISGNTGIAARRLSIIDLDTGHQPISNEDDSIWVVLNGAIYNYVETRKDLEKMGHVFKTKTDTEIIVHLYEEKGLDALKDLNGMFVFALYDSRKKGLWLVRDRLGIKPIYYAEFKDKLIFSSDLNSLNALKNFDVNPTSFLKYLGLAYVPTPYTIYHGVEKLPPAHYLWIEHGQVSCHKYWQLGKIQSWKGTSEKAAEELERLLADSVRLRLRSDVPVGVFLSGGLDSSAVTALAARATETAINTLTINFDKKYGKDSQFAHSVASLYSTAHTEVVFGVESLLQELDELIAFIDEPVADTAIIPTFLLSKIARKNGIKVLLTGAGGDEIFGGYLRHFRPRLGSPRWVAENLPSPLRHLISYGWSLFQPQRGLRAGDSALAFGAEMSGSNLAFYRRIFKDDNFYRELVKAIRTQFGNFDHEGKKLGYSYARMKTDLENYLVDNILSLTDKASMAASVESRVPLLDHRLVEFAFSLPAEINIDGAEPKSLFKRALTKYLPPELLNRSKEGFNAPIDAWMTKPVISIIRQELLGATVPLLKELLNLSAVEAVLVDPVQRYGSGNSIFSLYVFNRWWRTNSA